MFVCLLVGCASPQKQEETKDETESLALNEEKGAESQSVNEEDTQNVSEEDTRQKLIDDAYSKLNISNDFRSSFVHGNKEASVVCVTRG